MVETDVWSWVASVCRATLTMVVSKTTAMKPTTRMSPVLMTFGSTLSAGAVAAMRPTFQIRVVYLSYLEGYARKIRKASLS
jgi:hypothetical protein